MISRQAVYFFGLSAEPDKGDGEGDDEDSEDGEGDFETHIFRTVLMSAVICVR